MEQSETWVEAAAHCRALHAFLAEPKSQQQNDYMKQLLTGHHVQGVWLGGEDQVQEGKWFWSWSGAPVQGYTNWAAHEPNNNHGEDCMEFKGHSFQWNDRVCNKTQPFICQKDLNADVVG